MKNICQNEAKIGKTLTIYQYIYAMIEKYSASEIFYCAFK
jgi:hypothetical protein